MNVVILSGRFGQDPEGSTSSGGKFWMKGSIAVDNGKDRPPTWISLKAFDRTAEVICEHFRRGDGIEIQGRLAVEEWTTESGETRRSSVVVVQRFEFPKGRASDGGGPRPSGGPSPQAPRPGSAPAGTGLTMDDIPF